MTRPVVDLFQSAWGSLGELCSDLADDEWELATECPGWTVRDNLSHVVGTERHLLGDPTPAYDGEMPDHVKNGIGEENERWVASYRGRSGAEVLADFEATVARRLEQLRGFGDDDWNADTLGPTGIVPYEQFMDIRVMDAWVHEQDIRRATGRPGHHTGPVAELSIGRFVPAMGFVVGKRAGATEGQSVTFDLTGAAARRLGVRVVDGRAQVGDPVDDPTVTLTMDAETWWTLALGRRDGLAELAAGRVAIDGDDDLGRRVLTGMAFMI